MISFRVTKSSDRTVPIKKENMYMEENDISEENINSFDENLEEAFSPGQSEKYFDKYKVKHGHEWSHEEIFHLIEAWEQEESLYSLKYKYHPDRSKRLDAISRIVKKLRDKGIEVSDADVQSKIHSLRVYYSSRKNKAENPNRPDIAARIHWPYYEKLNFLKDNVLRRPSSGRRGPRESLKNNFQHLRGDTFHPAKKLEQVHKKSRVVALKISIIWKRLRKKMIHVVGNQTKLYLKLNWTKDLMIFFVKCLQKI